MSMCIVLFSIENRVGQVGCRQSILGNLHQKRFNFNFSNKELVVANHRKEGRHSS